MLRRHILKLSGDETRLIQRGGSGDETSIPPLTFCMVVTEGLLPHVTKPDGSFATTVDKLVAFERVEGSCCDHLCQFLHVGRFDVHNVCKASQGGRQHN